MFGQIMRVPKVLHIRCNTGTLTLPDMLTRPHTLSCHAYISSYTLEPVLQLLLACLSYNHFQF